MKKKTENTFDLKKKKKENAIKLVWEWLAVMLDEV